MSSSPEYGRSRGEVQRKATTSHYAIFPKRLKNVVVGNIYPRNLFTFFSLTVPNLRKYKLYISKIDELF